MKLYVSKSDFKLTRSCPTKLYYFKNNYPNTLQDDEYLKLMAEGGYMIGKMAQLIYPQGISISMDQGVSQALEDTKKALEKESVVLFEPVVLSGNKLIRVDILVKNKNEFELIEVKSKSWGEKDSFLTKKGTVRSEWQPYIEDIAFQTLVFKEAYPSVKVTSYLMLVDKDKEISIDNLTSLFEITDISTYEVEGFRSFDVNFTGDSKTLSENHFLVKLHVDEPVNLIKDDVKKTIQLLEQSANDNFKKISIPIGKFCKSCEFRETEDDSRDGFNECWGDLAKVKPHILDLYQFTLNKKCDSLIEVGGVSFDDVPLDCLSGKLGVRQKIQIEYTQKNEEWFSSKLKEIIHSCKYPLHFIDFETSRMAVPPHKGMKPYGNIAFQWSCHTIESPGSMPIHSEWINTEDSFPNITFAKTLMDQMGYDGTVFMWSPHENTTLSDIYDQLNSELNHLHQDLEAWLDHMTKKHDGEDYTMIDMCSLTKHHYFHPEMKGSTSIKYVLPAVWKSYPNLENHPVLKKFYKTKNGQIINPYDLLEAILIEDDQQVIRDGTGAMKAYQEMMYGRKRHDLEIRKKWTDLLRQYCELDTLAMVVIWEYWESRVC